MFWVLSVIGRWTLTFTCLRSLNCEKTCFWFYVELFFESLKCGFYLWSCQFLLMSSCQLKPVALILEREQLIVFLANLFYFTWNVRNDHVFFEPKPVSKEALFWSIFYYIGICSNLCVCPLPLCNLPSRELSRLTLMQPLGMEKSGRLASCVILWVLGCFWPPIWIKQRHMKEAKFKALVWASTLVISLSPWSPLKWSSNAVNEVAEEWVISF